MAYEVYSNMGKWLLDYGHILQWSLGWIFFACLLTLSVGTTMVSYPVSFWLLNGLPMGNCILVPTLLPCIVLGPPIDAQSYFLFFLITNIFPRRIKLGHLFSLRIHHYTHPLDCSHFLQEKLCFLWEFTSALLCRWDIFPGDGCVASRFPRLMVLDPDNSFFSSAGQGNLSQST